VHNPDPHATLEAHDELLFVATSDAEVDLAELLNPGAEGRSDRDAGTIR
jgi:hypothetical protein